MVIRVDVVDAALQAVYGPDTGAMLAGAAGGGARRPAGRQLDDARRGRARGARAADPALRPLRGDGRARARAPRQRRASRSAPTCCPAASWPRWWSRTPCCASSRARSGDEPARSRSRSARRSRAAPSTRTTPARPSYRGWEVPEVLLSGHHEQVRELAARAGAPAQPGPEPQLRRPHCGRGWPLPLTSAAPRRVARHAAARRRLFPRHERADRKPRAPSVAPRSRLPSGRPGARPLPGRRGHPAPHPGLRGRRAEGRRAAARGGRSRSASCRSASAWSGRSRCTRRRSSGSRWWPRRGPAGQALLPARPGRPRGARARDAGLPPGGRRHGAARRPPTARRRRRSRGRRRGRAEAAAEAERRGRRGAEEPAAEEAAAEEPAAEEAEPPPSERRAEADEPTSRGRGGRADEEQAPAEGDKQGQSA